MHIKATKAKLSGLGVKTRLQGSVEDQERVLTKHCEALGVVPVPSIDGQPGY